MSPDNLETLKVLAALLGAFAALLGGLYAIVTRPILHSMAAQGETMRVQSESLRVQSESLRAELRAEIRSTRDLFEEKLLRVEQVMDARLKHIEEELDHR